MKATSRRSFRLLSILLTLAMLVSTFMFSPVMAMAASDVSTGLGITPDELDAMAIDPQDWQIQDTMTWKDDWKDNPAIDYRNDDHNIQPTRDLKGLLVLVDYYDRGFITLDEVGSDPMGNPRVRVDTENGETVAEFWHKFLIEPGPWNQNTSIQDHWYDNAYGTWKIDVDVVGPYTLPYFEFQYGFYSQAIQNNATWPTVFPGSHGTRSTHPYFVALQDGYRFWDLSVPGGKVEYDFMFVHHAGYAQSNSWQELGEMMFADKMSVWNAPAGSLKDPYTGEPLGEHVSGYDFSGLARLDKIMGILTAPGFDIVRDWPNFYLSDMDLLWKQHITGIATLIMFGATFPTAPAGEFLTALTAAEEANLISSLEAYQAANPGSAHNDLTYRNYIFRHEFLEKYDLQKRLVDVNGPNTQENWTAEYKTFLANNTSEKILGEVIERVERARQLSINSTTNPNNGWAGSRYGADPWSSWYGALPIWSHTSGTTDAFANRRTDYSCQGESNGLGTYSHEFGHIVDFPDNYNDPFAANPTRVPVGQWDLMGGGSFGGPGGAHSRWILPTTLGASLPPNQILRGKILNGITDKETDVFHTTYAELGTKLAITEVYARNIPTNLGVKDKNGNVINGNRGFRITGMTNQIPRGAATTNLLEGTDKYGFRRIDPVKWNWGANSTFNTYTMEVVQRTAYDSFMSDNGVLLALNHDDVMSRGTNSTFIVDANPGGLSFADYRHPTTGAFVPLPDGGEQQIATALFHAGTHNDPTYFRAIGDSIGKFADDDTRVGVAGKTINEHVDTYNKLHFYILNKNYTPGKYGEILSYDVAVRRTDVDYATGGALVLKAVGEASPAAKGNFAVQKYSLTNTGETDIVRIVLGGELNNEADDVATKDQNVVILNNLYAIGKDETIEFDVFIKETGAPGTVYDTSDLLAVSAVSETTDGKSATLGGPVIEPGIILTQSKDDPNAGDYMTITASVTREIPGNTAVIDFLFDETHLEYAGVTVPTGVTLIDIQDIPGGKRAYIMQPDYEMEGLISLMFRVTADFEEDTLIAEVAAKIVVKDANGEKAILELSSSLVNEYVVPVININLIVLSNTIDAFGKDNKSPDWNEVKIYDFIKDGKIDILDVTYAALKVNI